MTRRPLLLAAAVLVLLFAAPHASAGEVHQKLLDQHAESVVSVKFTLSMQLSFQGQTMDREMSGAAAGILVDPVGLIVMDAAAFSPRGPRGMEIKASPVSIRIVFPGDPKEYEAVLGAKDSRLGMTFVRIKDLEGKQVKALSLDGEPEASIGDRLYGVTRLDQGFDYAPLCQTADVTGWVTKPRKMWAVEGGAVDVAHPLFTASGAVVGFVVRQTGEGSDAVRPFLLPIKVARSTIERAGRDAEKVLEEALEAEAEAAEEAADEEAADEETTEEQPVEDPGTPEAD